MGKHYSAEAADAWYDRQKDEAMEKGVTMAEQLAPHHHRETKEFLFDVKVMATYAIEAYTEQEARRKLNERIVEEGWTQDGEADLMEIDGEAV